MCVVESPYWRCVVNDSLLKSELADAAYAGLSDTDVLAAINAKTVSVARRVPTHEIKRHAIENGYWGSIVLACGDATLPSSVRKAAISARDWVDDPAGKIETLDMGNATTLTLLGALVAAGLMTDETKASLIALGTQSRLWREVHGFGEIGPGFLAIARRS